MPLPAFVWGVALETVVVQGASTCPSPSVVAAKVVPLVSASHDAPDVAQITRQGTAVSVSLARADGRLIGRQTLEGTACGDLADAAAVILASWENDDSRREGLSLSQGHRPPAAGEGQPPTVPTAESPHRRIWDVALGVGGTLGGGAVSPTAMVSGSFAPAAGAFGVRLAGGLAGLGTVNLPDGNVRWTRFVAGGGPKLGFTVGAIAGEAHVGGYFGWVPSSGEGFSQNQNDHGFELSFLGSLRLSRAGGGLSPWVEMGGQFWPAPVVAYELPRGNERSLPAFAVVLGAGILFGR